MFADDTKPTRDEKKMERQMNFEFNINGKAFA